MGILILDGSPRKNGNTSALASALAEGAKEAGCEVRRFALNDLKIAPCQACHACAKTGKCGIDDDMQTLYGALREADAAVFAVPIYWWNMSAQMMLFFGRLTAHLAGDDKLTSLAGKPVVLIVAYNYENCAAATIGMFNDFVDWIGVKLTVVRHCAKDGLAADMPDRLGQARAAGRLLAAASEQGRQQRIQD